MFSSTPESIIPERITTKGHIEYQLRVFEGGLSVVYIEVKLQDRTGEEHLNAVAQLIAEADDLYLRLVYKEPVLTFIYISISTGCDYANSQKPWIQYFSYMWDSVRRKIFRILSLRLKYQPSHFLLLSIRFCPSSTLRPLGGKYVSP